MESDFLVIGSGIAGLSYALKCADLGTVVIVTKKKEVDSATNLAQGGIAAVLGPGDTLKSHIQDTLSSGDGLCDHEIVRMVVGDGPDRVEELTQLGVSFVKDANNRSGYSLGKEGGHSCRRVAHAYDLTGREIETALLEKVKGHEKISVIEEHMVVDLLMVEGKSKGWNSSAQRKCVGAYVLENNKVTTYSAKITVLCSGGVGKVYLFTTNPDIATGDGIAMAFRAGASISNMEFVQFHPTCLYHPLEKNFLISEAVRGEGGILIDHNGLAFMDKYDERKDLATRDTVARAIDNELKKSGQDCVFLDISSRNSEFIKKRFPTIYNRCLSRGIDITKEPIPVVPAAHYMCGGVKTDKNGCTSIPGLMAIGETACTGLHGGNRLASNSLLEAVVFAEKAAQFCETIWPIFKDEIIPTVDSWNTGTAKKLGEEIIINHNWDAIRRVMWNYVGIVRSLKRLRLAQKRVEAIYADVDQHYREYLITPNMAELRNISLISLLIIQSALSRKESRGLHYMTDYPDKNKEITQTIFQRKPDGQIWDIELIEGEST